MKRAALFALVFAAMGASYWLGSDRATDKKDAELRAINRVYVTQPSNQPVSQPTGVGKKFEHPLLVVDVLHFKNDSAELRNHPDLWRIFIAELDTVIYLRVRPASD